MRNKVAEYIRNVIDKEKGYVNHKDDVGGETNFGITVETAREFGYQGQMIDLDIKTASKIYEYIYWLKPNYHLIEQVSPKISEEIFDTGVNCGTRRASQWLQRSLNALNKQGTLYPDLKVDGSIGPVTQQALKSLLAQRSLHGESVILKALNCLQGEHYIRISEQRQANQSFLFGWLRKRVEI